MDDDKEQNIDKKEINEIKLDNNQNDEENIRN